MQIGKYSNASEQRMHNEVLILMHPGYSWLGVINNPANTPSSPWKAELKKEAPCVEQSREFMECVSFTIITLNGVLFWSIQWLWEGKKASEIMTLLGSIGKPLWTWSVLILKRLQIYQKRDVERRGFLTNSIMTKPNLPPMVLLNMCHCHCSVLHIPSEFLTCQKQATWVTSTGQS